MRRLLARLKEVGDRAVVHGLRGRSSNRKLSEEARSRAIAVLSQEVYRGFGPTLASEYLAQKHKLTIGREALRQRMIQAGLWRRRRQKIEAKGLGTLSTQSRNVAFWAGGREVHGSLCACR